MSSWKGSLGSLISDRSWRLLIDLMDRRVTTSHLKLGTIRRDEFNKFRKVIEGCPGEVLEHESSIHVTPSNSVLLREALELQGAKIFPLDRSALSKNLIAGWVAASKELVHRRGDLAQAFGIQILETHDGHAPPQYNILDFTEPVDLVYTWVDGSDPEWIVERDRHFPNQEREALPTSATAARFASNDELRYSLRSVEAFLPWVNHIYIVTAKQKPEWLDSGNHKISIINHDDIFLDSDNLPTFNSHAIEAQIHNIEGLSEHFLYMNDDFMFGRKLHKNTFYTPSGHSQFATSDRFYESDIGNNLPINLAAENNAKLINEKFGLRTTLKFKHVAHPQRKSVLSTIERNHPSLVAQTASARFRSPSDLSIPSSLAHYYGVALGSAVPTDVSYKYIDMGSRDAQLNLAKLCWSDRPQMFCLNQVSGSEAELANQNEALEHFLEYAFPWKSSFEI